MILLLERKILSKLREWQREVLSLKPLLRRAVPSVPLEGKDTSGTLGLYSSGWVASARFLWEASRDLGRKLIPQHRHLPERVNQASGS